MPENPYGENVREGPLPEVNPYQAYLPYHREALNFDTHSLPGDVFRGPSEGVFLTARASEQI